MYALGGVQPDSIDPILDTNLFPIAQWLLSFKNGGIVAHEQKRILERKYSVKPINNSAVSRFVLASKIGITERTVRVRGVSDEVSKEDMLYFFEDYNIRSGDIRMYQPWQLNKHGRISNEGGPPNGNNFEPKQYLIDFASADVAARVVREKNYSLIDGKEIYLYWYNF